MRLGFISEISEQKFRFARENGFDGVELLIGIWEGQGDHPTPENARRAKDLLDAHGLKALSVQWAEDYSAGPDPAARFEEYARFANLVGTELVTVNAWVPAGLDRGARLDYFERVWTPIAATAEAHGLRVAIENCPHGGRNIGSSPVNFRELFRRVPSARIGLEFDPSHFVFQFMDYLAAIREFGERIFALHAKDTQIHYDKLSVAGIQGQDQSGVEWWRFRIPGYGDVDWRKVFVALSDIRYAGDIIIEHEDPTFAGEEGLLKAARTLRPLLF